MTESADPVPVAPDPPRRASRLPSLAGPTIFIALVLIATAIGVAQRGAPGDLGVSHGPARIALVGSDGSLSVVDPSGQAAILDSGPSVSFGFPAWSPDGRSIAAIGTRSNVSRIS